MACMHERFRVSEKIKLNCLKIKLPTVKNKTYLKQKLKRAKNKYCETFYQLLYSLRLIVKRDPAV